MIKVLWFPERAVDRLEDLLVFLSMRRLHLLRALDVFFQIAASMLPRLKPFVEELGDLAGILTEWRIVVHRHHGLGPAKAAGGNR